MFEKGDIMEMIRNVDVNRLSKSGDSRQMIAYLVVFLLWIKKERGLLYCKQPP